MKIETDMEFLRKNGKMINIKKVMQIIYAREVYLWGKSLLPNYFYYRYF